MSSMSPGTALRQLQQAQAGLKKARQAIRMAREAESEGPALGKVLTVGWQSLAQCHCLLAEIPVDAANEAVMTKQLAVQRYATALLVRLRRIARNEPGALDLGDDDADDEF
jgi:hypothetical protein